jgi:hypothetical protein
MGCSIFEQACLDSIKHATLQNFINKHTIDLEIVHWDKTKGLENKKGENLQDVNLSQIRCKIYPCQKSITCSRSVVFFHVKNQSLIISRSW